MKYFINYLKITILETILFSAIIKTHSFESLKLSPNDWIIPSTNTVSCIYFYDIQQCLRKLLEYYPLLNGIFKFFDKDKKVSVEQDDLKGGVLFVSTAVNISLNELPIVNGEYTNTKLIPETLQLINLVDSNTLFHVRHTRFSCGSVALGITLNHQIADAHSYFQLIKDWTQLYRNFDYQPNVCHQRSLLEPTSTEISALKNFNSDFNNRKSLVFNEENFSLTEQTKQIIIKVFRFSADELKRMKIDSITHLSSDIEYLSTFEVLTVHLYQHVMLARNHTTSSTTKLYISTNIRPRLTQPSLPINYFENAIMFSYLEMNISELINNNNLGLLASEVHKAIKANANEDIRTTLAWIVCQTDNTKIAPTFNLDQTDFTISAWNKMRMYLDSDFEFGVHLCRIMLPSDTKFNGAAILFSTEKDDTSIDVILGLDMNQMERLEKNSNFRKYREE